MANQIAAVALAQQSDPAAADAIRPIAVPAKAPYQESRVERGIELMSRWAGILAFVGAVAGIAYLIF